MRNRNNSLLVPLSLAVGLAALIVLAGLGWVIYAHPGPHSSSTPAANATAQPAAPSGTTNAQEITGTLGITLFGYDYVVTVEDTDHSDIFNDHMVASEDHTFRAYYVVMESDSQSGLEINPRYWRLFDDQTSSYPEVYAGKDPSLVTNKFLTRGEKEQGWVTFEIPKGGSRFKLAYDIPNIAEKASFVFEVG